LAEPRQTPSALKVRTGLTRIQVAPFVIAGDKQLFAFPSTLYQQLNTAYSQQNEMAVQKLLHGLKEIIQNEAKAVKADKVLMDTSRARRLTRPYPRSDPAPTPRPWIDPRSSSPAGWDRVGAFVPSFRQYRTRHSQDPFGGV